MLDGKEIEQTPVPGDGSNIASVHCSLGLCGATPTATPVPPTATKPAAAAPTAAPAAAATATKAPAPQRPLPAGDPKARLIRKLMFVAQDNGSDAKEYEMAKYTVEAIKQLGVDVDVQAMPYEQQSRPRLVQA